MKMGNGNKLDEKLSEALSQAVLSETESLFSDRDAFQNWLEKGAQRQFLARRSKIRRIGLAAAAVLLCAVLLSGSLLLSDALLPSLEALLSPWEGMAVPDSDSDTTYENGSIVIGGDGNGNVGTWTATFASYDDIPEKYREQIVWFEEMPEGYELESVEIINTTNKSKLIASFVSLKGRLVIKQSKYEENSVAVLSDISEEAFIANKTVYIEKIDRATTYTFFEGTQIVYIIDQANLPKEKIEALLASIKTGWNK